MGEYSRECNRLNIPVVAFMDKKDVTDFFSGLTNDCKMIEVSRRAETLIRKSDLRSGKPIRMQENNLKKREEKAEEKKDGETQLEESKRLKV
jgi:hypothetical protein